MADVLDLYVSDLKGMALLLLSTCESMDGIESITMYADTIDGIPYYHVMAYDKDHDEPVFTFSDLPDGIDGEGE